MSGNGDSSQRSSPDKGNETVKQTVVTTKRSVPRGREVLERQIYHSPLDRSDWVFFGGLALVTGLAVATRLYKISEPTHVAWDETHFGKHASWYIQGKFFFDVHPPLGKLIIAVAGVLTGYNGSFEFKEPGQEYGEYPYVGMRVVCAIMGLLVGPLAYLTVWELVHSNMASLLAGVLMICETGTLILSQYILLDPPLLCFVMLSTFCTARFINCRREAFDLEWWYWLSLSGMFIGCAFSVKWVGLFVIALVGMTTIKDLWDLLGDLSITMKVVAQHFIARALCLICWPVVIYMSIFAFHFLVLSNSGNGDGFFSSEFQSTLVGNELYEHSVPEFVGYGSVITLKNCRGGGGLLHSHQHLYPEEYGQYQQQQITAYTHKDDNNKWIVKKANDSGMANGTEIVKSGDWIFLEHLIWIVGDEYNMGVLGSPVTRQAINEFTHCLRTHRNLHSHAQKAPMTQTHFQVTGYGEEGVGDSNDMWQVEIVGGKEGDRVRTVTSRIKLRHVNIGCYLHSHSTQLPKWGWEQLEVTCNPRQLDKNNVWNIEGNENDQLPNISFDFYKPSYFSKFLESHVVMAESNNNMKPKEGEVTSKPWHWPINYQGQWFSGGDYRVYLLGNPIVFWSCDILTVIFITILLTKLFADQRGVEFEDVHFEALINQFLSSGCWLLLGWALHYLPFYLMGRVLYFHHYFPALMFSIMLGAIVMEFCVRILTVLLPFSLKGIFYHSALVLLVSVIIGSFVLFKPLAYGMTGPKADDPGSEMYGLKWFSSWEI